MRATSCFDVLHLQTRSIQNTQKQYDIAQIPFTNYGNNIKTACTTNAIILAHRYFWFMGIAVEHSFSRLATDLMTAVIPVSL
jgi:hypothetical protein